MAIDKKTAVRLAKACLWAYEFGLSRVEELLKFDGAAPEKTSVVSDDQNTSTSFAGVIEYADVTIVAFQGTITEFERDGVFRFDSVVDWFQNFKIKQVKTNESGLPGDVHFGFLDQLNLIYEEVKSKLDKEKPVVLTGHSQGGAIACLATKKLELDGFTVKETYTFASPRPGDAEFANSIKTPVFRVEFGHDIVPHVPPTLMQGGSVGRILALMGLTGKLPDLLASFAKMLKEAEENSYTSVGSLTYRPEDGDLQTDVAIEEELEMRSSRRTGLLFAGKDLGNHHSLENYIAMFD